MAGSHIHGMSLALRVEKGGEEGNEVHGGKEEEKTPPFTMVV